MNVCFFWCVMFLVFFMVLFFYWIVRWVCVCDEEIYLYVKFKLEFCLDIVLVLYFFLVDYLMFGRYYINEKLYIECDCFFEELEVFVCFKFLDNIEINRSKIFFKMKEIKVKVVIILEERKKKKNKMC